MEALGAGGIYSIGYEYTFVNTSRFKTNFKAGVAFYGRIGLALPAILNFIYSFGNHHLNIGVGNSFYCIRTLTPGSYQFDNKPLGSLGYRFQKPKGKIAAEIYYMPFLARTFLAPHDYYVRHLGGINFGYCF